MHQVKGKAPTQPVPPLLGLSPVTRPSGLTFHLQPQCQQKGFPGQVFVSLWSCCCILVPQKPHFFTVPGIQPQRNHPLPTVTSFFQGSKSPRTDKTLRSLQFNWNQFYLNTGNRTGLKLRQERDAEWGQGVGMKPTYFMITSPIRLGPETSPGRG